MSIIVTGLMYIGVGILYCFAYPERVIGAAAFIFGIGWLAYEQSHGRY